MLIECPKCKEEMEHTAITQVLVFYGTSEEPPEYEDKCPKCNFQGEFETVEVILCTTCEDVRVKDYGDQCGECHNCHQEELADAAKYPD